MCHGGLDGCKVRHVPTDAERARTLLTYTNYQKVADALHVSRAAVADWAKGRSVTPYRVRQLEQLLRPDLQLEETAPPEWARRLQAEMVLQVAGLIRAVAPTERLSAIDVMARQLQDVVEERQRQADAPSGQEDPAPDTAPANGPR